MKTTTTTITLQALAVTFAVAAVSATAQTNPPGLVSFWSAEADYTDRVGTNHGSPHGGVSFQVGRVGQSFAFDGATGYIQVPDSASLDLRPDATLMAWIYLDELPSHAGHIMHIVGKSQFGNDLDLQVEPDDRVHFFVGNSPAGPQGHVWSGTVLQTGIWYHVTAAFTQSSRIELFLNGGLEASSPTAVVRGANPNPLAIGRNLVFPGRFFHGRIDQVRAFDSAASEDTINDIFTAESGLARARIYTAVEVCWSTATNQMYQLQFAPSLDSTNWYNLGAPVQGTGTTECILESTRGQEKRFYRVRILP